VSNAKPNTALLILIFECILYICLGFETIVKSATNKFQTWFELSMIDT